jgi:Tfp pilus assembly protein PilX
MMQPAKQRGVVLVVSLVLLVTLTLLAATAVNTGTTSLRVIGNQQAQQAVEAATQAAIEKFVSTPQRFRSATCIPAQTSVTVNSNVVSVDITEPACLDSTAAPGYSAVWSLSPVATQWQITASGQNNSTGAVTAMVQGVAVVLPAGNCAPAPTGVNCPLNF